MKSNRYIYSILVTLVFANAAIGGSKIAVTTKVNGKAEIDRGNSNSYQTLKPGTVLEDGDQIKTGATGFVALIFIDDKSALKIKENTQIEITGKRTAASISKKINLDSGTLRAQVTTQRKGDFVVQTPTSVASVKGTDFWIISDPVTGDILIGINGVITFTNILSGMSMDVLEGLTGNSTLDGALGLDPTNPADIPGDPDEDEVEGVSELRIILEDPNGVEKVLLIQFQ